MTNSNHAAVATTTQTPPPESVLTQITYGPLLAQALYVAAKLGIADLLAAGPRPVRELAQATNTQERALYRVLRSLASVGVFTETDPQVFALNEQAAPPRTDAH